MNDKKTLFAVRLKKEHRNEVANLLWISLLVSTIIGIAFLVRWLNE